MDLGCNIKSTDSQPLDQWSVTGPGPSTLHKDRKRLSVFPQRQTESSETSEVFIRKKEYSTEMKTHGASSERESEGFESILWGISFTDLPGSESVSDVSQVITTCTQAFLSRDKFLRNKVDF